MSKRKGNFSAALFTRSPEMSSLIPPSLLCPKLKVFDNSSTSSVSFVFSETESEESEY